MGKLELLYNSGGDVKQSLLGGGNVVLLQRINIATVRSKRNGGVLDICDFH